jgi:hypothetical protein
MKPVQIVLLPFTTASKTIEYLGINLMMETKDFFNGNYKPMKKEAGEDMRRWKDSPCS